MKLIETNIADLLVLQRDVKGDARGYFERLFCQNIMDSFLDQRRICQINHSYTAKLGTVRGLHFQYPPQAEVKIVTCLKGQVLDVAVDLRQDSPTFLKHFSILLTETNHQSLIIPEGFAHGFQTLVNHCELIYFHTEYYNQILEGALNAVDPMLGIDWPLAISERSSKDEQHAFINRDFKGIKVK